MRSGCVESPSKDCRLCGVEVAVAVMSQHTKTVPCKVRRLIRDAHANGLVRCEDAIFVQLSTTTVRAGKLKTGLVTHPGKASMYSAIEESWADSVAVALMRRTEWSIEMRLDAVRRYAMWRRENPMDMVEVPLESINRCCGWRVADDTFLGFNQNF